MKNVSGKIVSTKPVNLLKATNILSNFVTIEENGGSQSVSRYLRCASVAFDELVYFKKHHKLKRNRTTEKSDVSERNLEDDGVRVMEILTANLDGESRKKEKKKNKRVGGLGSGKNDNVEEDNENVKEKTNVVKPERKKKRGRTEADE